MKKLPAKYYILDQDNLHGPYNADQITIHSFSPGALVWCEGMTQWEKIHDIPEIKASLDKQPQQITISKRWTRFKANEATFKIDLLGLNKLISTSGNGLKRLAGWSKSALTSLRSGIARFI